MGCSCGSPPGTVRARRGWRSCSAVAWWARPRARRWSLRWSPVELPAASRWRPRSGWTPPRRPARSAEPRSREVPDRRWRPGYRAGAKRATAPGKAAIVDRRAVVRAQDAAPPGRAMWVTTAARVAAPSPRGRGAALTAVRAVRDRLEAAPREAGSQGAAPRAAGSRRAAPRAAGPPEAGPRAAGPPEAGPRAAARPATTRRGPAATPP